MLKCIIKYWFDSVVNVKKEGRISISEKQIVRLWIEKMYVEFYIKVYLNSQFRICSKFSKNTLFRIETIIDHQCIQICLKTK